MKDNVMEEAVQRFQTPQYVFDLDELAGRVNQIRSVLGSQIHLCYAMKANPFLAGEMADLVERIEVCSPGEFAICRELDIPPEKLILSGVLKEKQTFYPILELCQEQGIYTVESPQHWKLLSDWAREHQKTLSVYIRLSSGNQFGVDTEQFFTMVEESASQPWMDIQGIHYFSGTQKTQWKKLQEELELLLRMIDQCREEYGLAIRNLEYGPGLSVGYFQSKKPQPAWDELLVQLAATVSKFDPSLQITLEMGRFLAAESGYYLTTIGDVKSREGGSYCIVDGGIHQMHYDGQMKGMFLPKIRHYHMENDRNDSNESARYVRQSLSNQEQWSICGALCTVNDVLCSRAPLQQPKAGDFLVFEKTGAYSVTEGMALFLSRELPAVSFYSQKNGLCPVRRKKEVYTENMPQGREA